jgi:predicted nucleic acid-binding Zn ribbon protein
MDAIFSLDREGVEKPDTFNGDITLAWQKTFQNDTAVDASTSQFMLAPEIVSLHNSDSSRIIGKIRNGSVQCLTCAAKANKTIGKISINYVNGGGHYVNDPLTATTASSEDTSETFSQVFKQFQAALWLNFERVTEESLTSLKEARPVNFDIFYKEVDYHYVFDVSRKDGKEYLDRVSKKTRSNLRYAKRLAEKRLEDFRIERIEPKDKSENEVLLEDFLELETAGWKATKGNPITFEADKVNYYRGMTNTARNSGNLSWYRMSENSKTMAMLLVFRRDEKLWVLKTAYDEAYRPYSPGGLILTFLLEEALSDTNIKTVDMISNYDWLERWNPEKHPYFSLRVLPNRGFRRFTSTILKLAHRNWRKLKT